jgi:CBS domain-containing protein
VLDDTGALVGILTESDLVRLAADLAEDLDRAELAITRGLGHE